MPSQPAHTGQELHTRDTITRRVGTPYRRKRLRGPAVTQSLSSEEAVARRDSLLFLPPALEQHLRFCPGDVCGSREFKALAKGQMLRTEHKLELKSAIKRMKN